jgi:ankyrin repeat protein
LGKQARWREVLVMHNAASKWDSYQQTMVAPANLGSAAKANDVAELARLLAAGANIDERDPRGYSPLMLAAYTGNQEAFDFLLEQGADANSADNAGNSVLMGASFKGYLSMVRQLLSAGANVYARNQAGMDALNFATQFGRSEVAELLTSAGVALPPRH